MYDAQSEGDLLLVQKIRKKPCSGLIHNQVILSDKSDKIREILNPLTTVTVPLINAPLPWDNDNIIKNEKFIFCS